MMWTMKNGTKIRIKDMSTEHIKNCIKMVERDIDVRNKLIQPSYYMKEIPYEMCYEECSTWVELNKELNDR